MRPNGFFCINSVKWSMSPCFLEAPAISGGNRWRCNMGKSKSEARLRRFSMSAQRGFVSAGHFHRDPFTQSRTAERSLNAAIVHADISRSYEEYLEIFDAFYADDVEGSSDSTKEPIRGKVGVCSLVFGFLVPLHGMAEIGGVSISVRQTPIRGDVVDETHSAGHWSWSGDRQGLHCELAHLQEMERLACCAGASLRPPAKRSSNFLYRARQRPYYR